MAALTVQSLAITGLAAVYSAASSGDGDTLFDDGTQQTFAHVKNGGGGSIDVTVEVKGAARRVAGIGVVTPADRVVAVPAGAERFIGPFAEIFRGTDGNVQLTYSGVTSVTVAALKVARAD